MPWHTGPRWYLVQTLPRQETRAIMFMSLAGFRVRCPLYIDNDHAAPTPRFPDYLFVQFDAADDEWQLISEDMPGVFCLFRSTEGRPMPLPPPEADKWIKDAVGVRDDTRRVPPLEPGTRVRIADGPFTSFAAVVERCEGRRLWVRAEIFGRITPIELRRDQVEV